MTDHTTPLCPKPLVSCEDFPGSLTADVVAAAMRSYLKDWPTGEARALFFRALVSRTQGAWQEVRNGMQLRAVAGMGARQLREAGVGLTRAAYAEGRVSKMRAADNHMKVEVVAAVWLAWWDAQAATGGLRKLRPSATSSANWFGDFCDQWAVHLRCGPIGRPLRMDAVRRFEGVEALDPLPPAPPG